MLDMWWHTVHKVFILMLDFMIFLTVALWRRKDNGSRMIHILVARQQGAESNSWGIMLQSDAIER